MPRGGCLGSLPRQRASRFEDAAQKKPPGVGSRYCVHCGFHHSETQQRTHLSTVIQGQIQRCRRMSSRREPEERPRCDRPPPQQNAERGAEESGQGERGSGLCPLVPLPAAGQTALDGGLLECALGQRPAGRKHRYESRRRVVARRGTDR